VTPEVSSDRLGGIAHVVGTDRPARWEVHHWFGAGQAVGFLDLGIALQAGALGIGNALPLRAAGELARRRVWGTRAVLGQVEAVPCGWHIVSEFAELIEAGCDAGEGTLLLAHTPSQSAHALAGEVYRLRTRVGPDSKILIREVGAQVRHSDERLLLKAGATLVLPREVATRRFAALVEALASVTLVRGAEPAVDKAFMDAVAARPRGYLAPAQFARAAAELCRQAQRLGVRSALLELWLIPGMFPTEALRVARFRRSGDLVTFSQDRLYVFLFACGELDVAGALSIVFPPGVADLFAKERRYRGYDAMVALLQDLDRRRDEIGGLQAVADAPAGAPHAAVVRRGSASPAVRSALPLRTQ
jgi:cellulose biosynthesis protein BcsE